MRICISGSMHHTERLLDAQTKLNALGHQAFTSSYCHGFVGKSNDEKESLKVSQKNNYDVIREFWDLMQPAQALLVMNIERHGIANYIGGNALMEMGFAHILKQKIFLLNPIPEIKFYKSEIEAMKPTILYGDFSMIKL